MIFAAIIATWMFIIAQGAISAGIDISATVNPNWNNTCDKDTLYTSSVNPAGEYGGNNWNCSIFCVTFEDDIFASVGNSADETAGLILLSG